MPIKVALMGLGAIGRGIARCALQKAELEIVAAVDLGPSRVGKKLSDVLDAPAPDVVVGSDASAEMRKAQGGVLLHATGSRLEDVEGELAQALTAGLFIVSTCEELSYPWLRHPEIAERLDKLAQKRKLAVLGTGVNPGFVMDRLPATLGAVCGRVDRVRVTRVVDSRTRRKQLQLKTGAGMNEEEFDRGVDEGSLGHVGLMESAALAALGVGLEVDEVDESIDPVEGDEDMQGEGFRVPKGGIVGIHQVARAFYDGKEVANLDLTIALGAPQPRDEIELEGDPGIRVLIPGGTSGDKATAWTLVHAAPLVHGSEPGLISVLDLPAGR
ncbi:MAG TPA: dihydrodipicolinate reductase [Myxococcales bacterium]|nr:dihydrodipicolinate reductase [Myxococcales bacterium]